jgi:hypothetical protein
MSDHKMSREIQEKLLGKIPFSRNAQIAHVPSVYLTKALDEEGKETDEYDIPEEYRPTFYCRPFSNNDKQQVSKLKETTSNDSTFNKVTRSNIVGVDNLYNAGTMELEEFSRDDNGGMSEEQFNSLPVSVKLDLFMFISSISGLVSYERSGL